MSFTKFNLNPKLLQALQDLSFTTPTPIQDMAIPPLMEGRDILAAAATGSGKTAAFLLPILNNLLGKPSGKTRALVLAPTRELAAQIVEHFNMLAKRTNLKAAAIYGGVGMNPQIRAFKRNVDLIAATPGRLLDHFQYSYSKLDDLEFLVLDEADRMLDMGFLPDVRRILKTLPSKRQTLLFSATMPRPIVQLSKEMLENPVALNIERQPAPAEGIRHSIFPVPEELKKHLLLKLLKRPEAKSVLAFTRTKHRANRLADFLDGNGVQCERIHGNRTQMQRTQALKGFKDGRFQVLVATDIAARGIDVEALGIVVNFDVPVVPEDYIHRSGRTARAELTGDAYTLVSPQEEHSMRAIERHIGKSFARQKIGGFDYARRPAEKLEVPLSERIAAIRAKKAEERGRFKAKSEARSRHNQGEASRPEAGGKKPFASSNSRRFDKIRPAGEDRRQAGPPHHNRPMVKHGSEVSEPARFPSCDYSQSHEGPSHIPSSHAHYPQAKQSNRHFDNSAPSSSVNPSEKPRRQGSPHERKLRDGSYSRLYTPPESQSEQKNENVKTASNPVVPFRRFNKKREAK